ncbi:hypothetical protein [Flagellimonas marina]|uniref:Collagen-like protein n=1 Tax=Flagellimonas marina TaxID=1775168 RepID=A0ABV8PI58_9FLAO
MKLLKFMGVALVAMALCLSSCSGEDGKDGINGLDGVDGTNGINGTNGADGADGADGQDGMDGMDGQDGANGVGFDELTKFGYITLEMDGTRVDNVAFQDSTSFRFSPINADQLAQLNFVNSTETEEGYDYQFNIGRFLSAPDNVYQESTFHLSLNVSNPGTENETINSFIYAVGGYAVIGDDNKYFVLNSSYDVISDENVFNVEITDITYDAETKHLTFNYAWTVSALGNGTGNELNMSGMVDVILLEEVEEAPNNNI